MLIQTCSVFSALDALALVLRVGPITASRTVGVMATGVATGWTGVDMPTSLLPEVLKIGLDAYPMSFYYGRKGWGRSGLRFAK